MAGGAAVIVLPEMPPEQTASWLGLLDLHERLPEGWTLIGGQLVRPTLPTAGGTQALQRSETVEVTVAGREGAVRRPTLVGALVGKAAALGNAGDPGIGRHRRDFAVLAGLLTACDFRGEELTKKDCQRLRAMVAAVRKDRALLLDVSAAEASLDRLVSAADL